MRYKCPICDEEYDTWAEALMCPCNKLGISVGNLDKTCACGKPPRRGSSYCSDECFDRHFKTGRFKKSNYQDIPV